MPLKGILIIGEDPKNHQVDEFHFYKGNPDYLIIDGSQELMTQEEFKAKLQGHEIDSNTRIDIWAHGNIVNEREGRRADHSIALLSDAGLTKDVLRIIAEHSGSKPIQTHLWSCFGGTAARAVEDLPEGSIVMGHGPERSFTLMDINFYSIKSSILSTINKSTRNMSSIGQDLVNNLPSYVAQDLNIGIKGLDGSVRTQRLAESIAESADIVEITNEDPRYYFRMKSIQIEGFVKEMIDGGVLSSDVDVPELAEYSDEELRSYEYNRIFYNIFFREDDIGVDFKKLIENGRIITKERALEKKLGNDYLALLDENFQKKILGINSEEGATFLLSCVENSRKFSRTKNAIPYLLSIAQKHEVLTEYTDIKQSKNYVLNSAIHLNQYKIVRQLIEAGVDVNKYYKNTSPLSQSITFNNQPVAIALIEAGADVNALDDDNTALIIRAVHYGMVPVIKKMVENGALLNVKDKFGDSPLNRAIRNGNIEIAQILIDNRIDLNERSQLNGSPIIQAIRNNQDEIALAIINSGRADLSSQTYFSETPLKLAIEKGKETIVQSLISKNIDLNVKDNFGFSYLDFAISHGNDAIVKELIEGGMDINGASFGGQSPIHVATATENTEILKYLIENGANLEAKDNFGRNVIQAAIYHGNKEAVEILLEANPGFSLSKEEMLRIAIMEDKVEEVRNLISEGVSLNDSFGSNYAFLTPNIFHSEEEIFIKTLPFSYLKEAENLEIAKILIQAGSGTSQEGLKYTIKNSKNLEVAKYIHSFLSEEEKVLFNASDFSNIRNKEVAKFLFQNISKEERAKIPVEQLGKFIDQEVINILKSDGFNLGENFITQAIKNWDYESSSSLVEVGIVSSKELLIKAIALGNEDIVEKSIRRGVNTEENFGEIFTEYFKTNNIRILKAMQRGGFDLNSVDENGDNILFYAIKTGNYKEIPTISKLGVDINRDGEGLIIKAINSNDIRVVDALIESGLDLNQSSAIRRSFSDIDMLEFLLTRDGVDVNSKDYHQTTVLHKACVSEDYLEVVTLLVEKGANIDEQNKMGNTPLHLAIGKGNYEIMKFLIESGADLNIVNSEGKTPFTRLDHFLDDEPEERNKAYKIAKYIVKNLDSNLTKNLSIEDKKLQEFVSQEIMNCGLRRAIISGEKFSSMENPLGDPNGVDSEGKSMLSYAIEAGNIDAVKKLIKMGADVNSVSEGTGMSPLHEAAKMGNREIYNILLEAGGDPSLLDKKGKRPLDYIERPSVVASSMRSNLEVGAKRASPSPAIGVIETKASGHAR